MMGLNGPRENGSKQRTDVDGVDSVDWFAPVCTVPDLSDSAKEGWALADRISEDARDQGASWTLPGQMPLGTVRRSLRSIRDRWALATGNSGTFNVIRCRQSMWMWMMLRACSGQGSRCQIWMHLKPRAVTAAMCSLADDFWWSSLPGSLTWMRLEPYLLKSWWMDGSAWEVQRRLENRRWVVKNSSNWKQLLPISQRLHQNQCSTEAKTVIKRQGMTRVNRYQ